MGKNNVINIALTVVIASMAIIGGTYAYKGYFSDNSPEDVVKDFYQSWMDYEGNPLTDKMYKKSKFLTKSFSDKIENIVSSFEQGGYDPVLCAQDIPEKIKISKVEMDRNTANIFLTEDFYGQKKNIMVYLVKEIGGWKIENVICQESDLFTSTEIQNAVGEYIRDNISSLSSEKEMLGGKFYITSLKFLNDKKGEVEYEDGHNAYRATFNYEIENGKVKVSQFNIVMES